MAIAISVCYDEPNDQCIAPQLRSHRIPGSWNPNNRRCTPRAEQRVCVFQLRVQFPCAAPGQQMAPGALLAAGPSFLYPATALSAGRDKSESVAKNTDSRREGSISPWPALIGSGRQRQSLLALCDLGLMRPDFRNRAWSFSNSGRGVKLSVTSLPGSGFSPQ